MLHSVALMGVQVFVHADQQQPVVAQAVLVPGLCVGWWITAIAAAWHLPLRKINGWISQVAGHWQFTHGACVASDYSALEAVPPEAAAKVLESNWIALAILSLRGQVRVLWREAREDFSRRAR